MKGVFLIALVILLTFPSALGHDHIQTLSFHDLNLQQHEILVYYSNGSLAGEILSNESLNYNTSQSLNIHIVPRRMDLVTAGGRFESYLWGYLPMLMFIFLILAFIGMLISISYWIITGKIS